MRTGYAWPPIFGALVLVLAADGGMGTTADSYSPADMCEYGERKHIACNSCRCLWTWGMWTCTRNVCSPRETRGLPKACYHLQVKWRHCNYCLCQYGKWVCDRKLCNTKCTDGSVKHIDCNTCYCIGGSYRCTEYPCVVYNEILCEPKTKKKINCNICACNSTGIGLTCTDMECF